MADLGAIGTTIPYCGVRNLTQFNKHVSGIVVEDGVPIANAVVALTAPKRYGAPRVFQEAIVGTFNYDFMEIVRRTLTLSDGTFELDGLPDDAAAQEYVVVAYNPDSETENLRAVGAFISQLSTTGLELDFAHQDQAAWRMFFLL